MEAAVEIYDLSKANGSAIIPSLERIITGIGRGSVKLLASFIAIASFQSAKGKDAGKKDHILTDCYRLDHLLASGERSPCLDLSYSPVPFPIHENLR
ncbi:MAG: hypothetical protein ACFFAY_04655 [Promethearchaeota archaeon]